MTVSSTTSKASYSGNGTTTAFTVPFYFLEAADVQVILRSGTTETVQTLTTNYTVAGAGVTSGGTVTMLVAPAVGTTLTILRNIEATQETDLVPNDRLPAETLEVALDKATMLIQQLDEEAGRSLKFPASDTTASAQLPVSTARASKFLSFDASGLPVATVGVDATTDIFTQSGAGAVSRSVNSKLRDFVSVKDFGAVGDDLTDDTAAIQAALDASSGVFFPSGSYKITSSLQMNDFNFVMGSSRSSIIRSTHNGAIFKGKGVTPESGTGVRRFSGGGCNLWLEGPALKGVGFTASIALDMRGCTMFKWSNILIRNVHDGVALGDNYSSYYNEFSGVDVLGVHYGYFSDALGNENTVFGGRITDCEIGTRDSDNTHNKYVGLAIEVFAQYGHLIVSPATQNIHFITSRLENAAGSTATGIKIDATSQDTLVIQPHFQGLYGTGVEIDGAGVRGNIFSSENLTIASGTAIKWHKHVTTTLDIGNVLANSTVDTFVSISGVIKATDTVIVSVDSALPAGLVISALAETDGVYVRLGNITGSPIDPPSLTFQIDVWRHV
jgi:hypothetical protein